MVDCYRAREWREMGFELRWVNVPCLDRSGRCAVDVHRLGVMGFNLAAPHGDLSRWLVVSELVDENEDLAESAIDDCAQEGVHGWQLATAAFGLPWEALSAQQLEKQGRFIGLLTTKGTAIREMHAQGVHGLIAMRRLVGRNLSAMGPLLEMLGRYRDNVGGVSGGEFDVG